MFRSTLLTLAFAAFASASTVVTFNPSEVGGIDSLTAVTNQWASFGITASNLYFYQDSRDTFDTFGLSRLSNATSSSIFFAAPTALSIDYLVLEGFTGVYKAYDSSSNLLSSFQVDASQTNALGSHTFNANNISRLDLEGIRGAVQVSTLRFNQGSEIPEPSTFALIGLGIVGFALRRR